MEIQLYPHNQETYRKIQEAWMTTDKVAVVQATGTGKSYLILKLIFDFPNAKKIVLAPSHYILNQFNSISDEGFSNTEFLTYAKLANMSDEEISEFNPMIIVLDEFHRCGADVWGNGVKRLLDLFPDTKVLGTSATPIRYLDNERDISDELFDGNVVTNITLTQAIVAGILPMPKYVSALYTFDNEVDKLKEKITNSLNDDDRKNGMMKELDALKRKLNKSHGIPSILKKYLPSQGGKFIVFCKDKKHLTEMKGVVIQWFEKLRKNSEIEVFSVYNEYIDSDIEFEKFKRCNSKGNIKLLFCINMLNEGVHINDITGAILLRPTISPIIYYQQIGRTIQTGNDRTPLIFDFVNNFNNLGAKQFKKDLQKSSSQRVNSGVDIDVHEFTIFDEIQDVVYLFEDIESQLIDDWDFMYNLLCEYNEEFGNVEISQKSVYKEKRLGTWVQVQRGRSNYLTQEKIDKLNNINFIWRIREGWDSNFELLCEYKKENNNSLVGLTQNKVFKGKNIGAWCLTQRQRKNKDELDATQFEKLSSIGFSWNPVDDLWNEMYECLCKYVDDHGAFPNKKNIFVESKNLSVWCQLQRQRHKKEEMKDWQYNNLIKIGFPFVIIRNWNEWFLLLCKYKATVDNFYEVSNNLLFEGEKLGQWVKKQKEDFRKGVMIQERVDKFQEINFNLGYYKLNWNEMFELLVKYKKEFGHCIVGTTESYNEINLGGWVRAQRKNFSNNELDSEKVNLLNSIGFSWSRWRKNSIK